MRGTIKYIVLLTFVALFAVFIVTNKAEAASLSDIVIAEVYYDTVGDDNKEEWVEIYNTTFDQIEISGYYLSSNNDANYLFPADTFIESHQYLVIAKNDTGFNALYGFNPDITGMTLKLANGGDYVVLFDANEVELDQAVWESGIYPGITPHVGVATGHSIERTSSTIDTDNCNLDFIDQINPTPKSGYEVVEYSDEIIINEVVPKPENGADNEYIELFNTSNQDVDLSGWRVDDIDGGSSSYLLPQNSVIISEGHLVIYKLNSRIALNDSGDWVRLIAPDGVVKDTIMYDKAVRGESYSRFIDGWKWTLTLTPNEQNVFSQDEEMPALDLPTVTISICEARGLKIDEKIRVEGVVTVLPGVLSNSSFYIQKNGCGIQVYSYWKKFPVLHVGDKVKVSGVMASYFNESRIKISDKEDVVIFGNDGPENPLPATADDCNEETEGEVVEVEGIVTRTSGNTFWIRSGGKEIKVLIRKLTGIKKPRMRKGDRVRITGIVSQYKDYYRILPYEQSGVIILSSAILPNAGSEGKTYFKLTLIIFSVIVIWKYFQKTKKRHSNLQKKLPAI